MKKELNNVIDVNLREYFTDEETGLYCYCPTCGIEIIDVYEGDYACTCGAKLYLHDV